jgi:four helix bundle protein
MLPATRFEELAVWQLSEDVKDRVAKVLARSNVKKDYEYCRQIRKSTRSTSALVAEGFGRFRHKEFANYLNMALGELNETRDHLREGAQCGYFSVDEFRELWRLCHRIKAATLSLLAYLRSEDAKKNEQDIAQRRVARRRKAKPKQRSPKNPS